MKLELNTSMSSLSDPAKQFANPYLAMGSTKREEPNQWIDVASGAPEARAVIYVDPDGEFIMFAIAMGAITNMIVQGLTGNVNSIGAAQEKINTDIKNEVALDVFGKPPQERYLPAVKRARGKIQIKYQGSVPRNETLSIMDSRGKEILNIGGGSYSPTEISVFNSHSLTINLSGFPIVPSSYNHVLVMPKFQTRVLIYVP